MEAKTEKRRFTRDEIAVPFVNYALVHILLDLQADMTQQIARISTMDVERYITQSDRLNWYGDLVPCFRALSHIQERIVSHMHDPLFTSERLVQMHRECVRSAWIYRNAIARYTAEGPINYIPDATAQYTLYRKYGKIIRDWSTCVYQQTQRRITELQAHDLYTIGL